MMSLQNWEMHRFLENSAMYYMNGTTFLISTITYDLLLN